MLPLDDVGVAYALVALRKIVTIIVTSNYLQEKPAIFLFFKKNALTL